MSDSVPGAQSAAARVPTRRRADFPFWLAAATDVFAVVTAAAVSYGVVYGAYASFGSEYETLSRIVAERGHSFTIVLASICLWFFLSGHYHKRMPFWSEAKEVVQLSALGLLAEGFLLYSGKADVSRLMTFATWAVAPFALMAFRLAVKAVGRARGVGVARLLVVGYPAEIANAVSFLRSDKHLGYEVVDQCEPMTAQLIALRMIECGADEVVVALSGNDQFENVMTAELKMGAFRVLVIPPRMGLASGMNVQYVLGEQSILLVDRVETVPILSRKAKRVFDVMLSLGALAVLSIPMLLVTALVKLDRGPAIFGHWRVGEGGKAFRCYKFRSMRPDAQAQLEELLERDPVARAEWDANRKLKDDPRVTWLGKAIRKTGVDEFPQFFNVLKGDMSLVGPRPVTESELSEYGADADRYKSVRPGITGLWQVSGRNDVTYAQRVSLDAWYVMNWSPWHDIAIIMKTIPAVLSRKGAY